MDKEDMAKALVNLDMKGQKDQELYTQTMMDQLNRMKSNQVGQLGIDNDLGYANLRAYQNPNALQGALGVITPLGNLEYARTANPMSLENSIAFSNQMPIGNGMAQVDLLKSLSTPERTTTLGYNAPMSKGQFRASATTGQDAERQKVKEMQMQYLQQLNKNMGVGVYGKKTPYDQSVGLQVQGRF